MSSTNFPQAQSEEEIITNSPSSPLSGEEIIAEDLESGYNDVDDEVILGSQDLKVGVTFPSFDGALQSVKEWCDSNYEPFVKRSTNRGTFDDDGDRPGQIQMYCTHGIERKSKATSVRPLQRVYFTGCKARIYINQKDKDVWVVTKADLEHKGHMLGPDVYHSYSHVKKITPENEKYVEEMMEVNAAPRNIAKCLSHKTGHNLSLIHI